MQGVNNFHSGTVNTAMTPHSGALVLPPYNNSLFCIVITDAYEIKIDTQLLPANDEQDTQIVYFYIP